MHQFCLHAVHLVTVGGMNLQPPGPSTQVVLKDPGHIDAGFEQLKDLRRLRTSFVETLAQVGHEPSHLSQQFLAVQRWSKERSSNSSFNGDPPALGRHPDQAGPRRTWLLLLFVAEALRPQGDGREHSSCPRPRCMPSRSHTIAINVKHCLDSTAHLLFSCR